MGWKIALCLLVLLLTAGCGRQETAEVPPPAGDGTPLEAVSAPEPSGPETLWTLDLEGRTVLLREGGAPETWELVLEEGGETAVLKTLTENDGPFITARLFTDILGWDGFALRGSWNEGGFGTTTYYILDGSALRSIAYSFGYTFDGTEDYSVDLDGDGVTELVTVNTYGGDGYREVQVFRRQGDGVEIGRLQNRPELPDHDDWGVNSTAQDFDPETGKFQIHYDFKDTHPSEEQGLVETAGLEWFVFTPFEEESANG